MEHIALYRAWRPQSFQDMVGQQHIIRTLQNAIREQRLSHAYLFSGPRGTGKTTAAKLLAKAVNCENGPAPEPCNECDACRRITAGTVMDVLEIDAASNRGVDEIRDLREKVKYAPTEVRQKVYIIDEVHMLTTEAFNALLKTLEEPPPHVMFILATTEPHRLPATVISRCQRFDFRRVSLEEQSQRLKVICEQEGIAAEDEAIEYIARLSDGGMRDALSILDQIASFSDGQVSYQQVLDMTGGIPSRQFAALAKTILEDDIGGMLQMIEGFMQEGKSADKCMENLLYYFRDLLMIKMVPQADKLTERVLEVQDFKEMALAFSRSHLFRIIDTLNHYQTEMKYAAQPQMLFEVALLKLCSLPKGDGLVQEPSLQNQEGAAAMPGASASEVQQLKGQLAELERKLEQALQGGLAAGAGGGDRAAASGGRSATRSPAPRISSPAKLPSGMDRYVAQRNNQEFMAVQGKWNQILQAVKDAKVTIHAWFVNGEPVSVSEDAVLVAFKNDIHRETTEKPANKQLIEQVMERQLGRPCRLVTMMLKDWNEAIQGAANSPSEPFELEPPPDDANGGGKEPWVDEAIQLFGEELVVIKE
ncbi:DNA polymerase-3 subunit gamma/tau [Fontibacillus phaseoli]|uniref:DNA-directed DNA polymerase n=1 Tax=Fontibacillus phaseoli TaxID=1416533 RepID=A0A369B1E8_9BACL|nr:DNA polymerase III subunit gamma/tau [Fontibacillus phaseoli]RCX14398.1 DNA polymerase-3 subunit gamma/tau [Fontibacillus phaseoli]